MNELHIESISGVDCYEKDGTAYLKLENLARGLGFTKNTQMFGGTELMNIWRKSVLPQVAKGQNSSPKTSSTALP